MAPRNWSLILGCVAFIGVGAIAILAGATVPTAAYRAVVGSFTGGFIGFVFDYFASHAEVPAGARVPAKGTPTEPAEPTEGAPNP
ncbi:MAG: hypothetical protein KGR26_08570 [Cyanobacteria bacterium REEB65]|nr:hypothetical protein [Cyanobacteria bacterium REEB65]